MSDVFDKSLESLRKVSHNSLFDLIDVTDGLLDNEIFDQPRFLEDTGLLQEDFLGDLTAQLAVLAKEGNLPVEKVIPLANRIAFARLMNRSVTCLRSSRVQMAANHASDPTEGDRHTADRRRHFCGLAVRAVGQQELP